MRRNRSSTGTSISRRRLLRGTGGALSAATVSLAGCTSLLPPMGQRVRFGRVDAPERGPPVYESWVPQPSRVQIEADREIDPLATLAFARPGTLGAETLGAPFSLAADLLRVRLDYYGMGFERYDWALGLEQGTVLHGDIDRTVVDRTLRETVYEHVKTGRGYDWYRRMDRDVVVAVSEEYVVTANGTFAMENAKTYVDTERGQEKRLATEDATRLFDAVGASPTTMYGLGLGMEGDAAQSSVEPIADALSFDFDDEAAYFYQDGLFPEGEVPSRSAIREGFQEPQNRAMRAAAVDITIDDRLVTVELRLPADSFRENTGPPLTPQVTWKTRRNEDADTIRLTHVAGESFDASTTTILLDGTPTDEQFADQYSTIGPGDGVAITAPDDGTGRLRVQRAAPDGDSTATIYTTEIEKIQAEKTDAS